MKVIFISVAFLLTLTSQNFAAAVLPTRPAETKLLTELKISVKFAGKQSGWVVAPKGSTVAVKHEGRHKLKIDFAGFQAWITRSSTDFDQRLATFNANQKKVAAQAQHAKAVQDAAFKQKQKVAGTDFQRQHASYQNPLDNRPYPYDKTGNPLDKGAYDQQRSVVDYYDWLGRRYHIGTYGQRIYD